MVATSFGGMSEMRITKLHHASLLVETVQARVLIDPGSLGPRPDSHLGGPGLILTGLTPSWSPTTTTTMRNRRSWLRPLTVG